MRFGGAIRLRHEEFHMKIVGLMTTAAAAALFAGSAFAADLGMYAPPAPPPPAVPVVAGDIAIGMGLFSETYSGEGEDTYNAGIVTGVGRAAVPVSGSISFEGEVTARSVFDDGESYYNGFAAVGHLYTSNPTYAAGVFGGYASIIDYSGYVIGGEANYYAGPFTLFAQVAYWNGQDYYDGILQGRLGGHYYFNPDTRATLDLNYYSNNLADVWSAEGKLEHRFTGTNWSGFVSGGYVTDNYPYGDWHAWTAKVGFSLLIDPPGSTLQSHDKAVPFDVKLPWFVPDYIPG
jgi:hypothetical protein